MHSHPRTHSSFELAAISHLHFTLSVLSPHAPFEKNFLSKAELTPFLPPCLINKTSSGFLWSPCTTSPPFEIWRDWDGKSLDVFCSFIPVQEKIEREKMTKGGDKKGSSSCPLPQTQTHRHALMPSFICTFTLFHDSSFMHGPVAAFAFPLSAFGQEQDGTQERLERCCSVLCWHPEEGWSGSRRFGADNLWPCCELGVSWQDLLWSALRLTFSKAGDGAFQQFPTAGLNLFPQTFSRHRSTEATLRRSIRNSSQCLKY